MWSSAFTFILGYYFSIKDCQPKSLACIKFKTNNMRAWRCFLNGVISSFTLSQSSDIKTNKLILCGVMHSFVDAAFLANISMVCECIFHNNLQKFNFSLLRGGHVVLSKSPGFPIPKRENPITKRWLLFPLYGMLRKEIWQNPNNEWFFYC